MRGGKNAQKGTTTYPPDSVTTAGQDSPRSVEMSLVSLSPLVALVSFLPPLLSLLSYLFAPLIALWRLHPTARLVGTDATIAAAGAATSRQATGRGQNDIICLENGERHGHYGNARRSSRSGKIQLLVRLMQFGNL